MGADTLRQAARLMRERAETATGGNWTIGKNYGAVVSDTAPDADEVNGGHDDIKYYGGVLIGESFMRRNSAHVASWHPAVAAAVACWLERTADSLESLGYEGAVMPTSPLAAAVDVARAYLRDVPVLAPAETAKGRADERDGVRR